MTPRPTFAVDSWDVALVLLRHVVPDAEVTIPKPAEPILPPGLAVRRSNVPWSVHKGARRVYREDHPGEHVQIREYPDRWTVQLDAFNPHYRPVRHVVVDAREYTKAAVAHPLRTAAEIVRYGPIRTVQLGVQVSTAGTSASASAIDRLLPRGAALEPSVMGTAPENVDEDG